MRGLGLVGRFGSRSRNDHKQLDRWSLLGQDWCSFRARMLLPSPWREVVESSGCARL